MSVRASIAFACAAAAIATSLGGCGSQDAPIMPAVPTSAVLDAYDGAVLEATSDQAPTFAEISSTKDDRPRRFRAWLGWALPRCEPCPPDQTAVCTPKCTDPTAYVCARPARTIACQEAEVVSTSVTNADGPVPPEGPYLFEGRFASADAGGGFTVERISALAPPSTEGR
jgi:hypothetical protein